MLASHFHDMIARQFSLSPLVILAALVVLVSVVDVRRVVVRRLLAGLACIVALAGVYLLAEVPALRHNHLCHGHGSDACAVDHDRQDHTHWFGGRASRPRS